MHLQATALSQSHYPQAMHAEPTCHEVQPQLLAVFILVIRETVALCWRGHGLSTSGCRKGIRRHGRTCHRLRPPIIGLLMGATGETAETAEPAVPSATQHAGLLYCRYDTLSRQHGTCSVRSIAMFKLNIQQQARKDGRVIHTRGQVDEHAM
jgi:hypothetical protein